MKLFVLGATGGVGRQVVTQGVARGHEVTAFVRSPDKLAAQMGLRVVKGDVRDERALEQAMAGTEAVITSVGPPIPFTGKTTIMGDAGGATVRAMAASGVRRVIAISGELQFAGAGPPKLVRVLLLRHLERDQAELERSLRASDHEWTIVRPAPLTNGPLTSSYRSERDALPTRPKPISRADVAHFLLATAETGAHARDIVGLAR